MEKQSRETEPQLRLRVVQGGDIILGPGGADLLTLIRAHGSIAAGRQMGMSHKRAWAPKCSPPLAQLRSALPVSPKQKSG